MTAQVSNSQIARLLYGYVDSKPIEEVKRREYICNDGYILYMPLTTSEFDRLRQEHSTPIVETPTTVQEVVDFVISKINGHVEDLKEAASYESYEDSKECREMGQRMFHSRLDDLTFTFLQKNNTFPPMQTRDEKLRVLNDVEVELKEIAFKNGLNELDAFTSEAFDTAYQFLLSQ